MGLWDPCCGSGYLVTVLGLLGRAHLRRRHAEFGKTVHADVLADLPAQGGGPLPWSAGIADIFDAESLRRMLPTPAPDLVVTDLPYGRQVHWAGAVPRDAEPMRILVAVLCAVLDEYAVVAFTVEGRKVSLGADVMAQERFRVGTRAGFVGRVEQFREAQ